MLPILPPEIMVYGLENEALLMLPAFCSCLLFFFLIQKSGDFVDKPLIKESFGELFINALSPGSLPAVIGGC